MLCYLMHEGNEKKKNREDDGGEGESSIHSFTTQEQRIRESLTRTCRTGGSCPLPSLHALPSPTPSPTLLRPLLYPSSTPPLPPTLQYSLPRRFPPLVPYPSRTTEGKIEGCDEFFSKRGSCFGCTALSMGKVPTLRAPERFGVCGGSPGMHRSAS
ncbi:hypothetical protein L873DRAFT_484933 [Choiromyces venosus 120613-1]|uniref:Uncharacterized protein n=1 Tax=Choiromyces venosus 120613-1 TaxID=1336337 RepID=A0A3N4JUR3_9PEZI|nr:hypothetical protein L873DRAFT_484933 [Choiromyces venosus 120613-1]